MKPKFRNIVHSNFTIKEEAKQCATRAQIALEGLIHGYSDQLMASEIEKARASRNTMIGIVKRLKGGVR